MVTLAGSSARTRAPIVNRAVDAITPAFVTGIVCWHPGQEAHGIGARTRSGNPTLTWGSRLSGPWVAVDGSPTPCSSDGRDTLFFETLSIKTSCRIDIVRSTLSTNLLDSTWLDLGSP